MSDGEGNLFYFDARRSEFGIADVGSEGLSKGRILVNSSLGDVKIHVSPASCSVGYTSGGRRFFALDRKKRIVRAWTQDGQDAGVVFSYASREDRFVSLSIHPPSGDLLLGTGWPGNSICRFRPDGTEVHDSFWPTKGCALSLVTTSDGVWALGIDAMRLSESMARSRQRRFGRFSCTAHGLAETPDGFWIATSQGALFYRKDDLSRCAWRLGGLSGVGALALHDGRILAGAGWRMLNLWLDDQPGDQISSDDNWRIAKNWNEKIDLIEVRSGIFYLRDATHGGVTAFDPSVTEWTLRDKRQRQVADFIFKSRADRTRFGPRRDYAAVVAPDGIRLYHHGQDGEKRLVQTVQANATAIAGEGEWLVTFEPARRAVVRYRLIEEDR